MGKRGCPLKQFRFTDETVLSFVVTVNRPHTRSHLIFQNDWFLEIFFVRFYFFGQVEFGTNWSCQRSDFRSTEIFRRKTISSKTHLVEKT